MWFPLRCLQTVDHSHTVACFACRWRALDGQNRMGFARSPLPCVVFLSMSKARNAASSDSCLFFSFLGESTDSTQSPPAVRDGVAAYYSEPRKCGLAAESHEVALACDSRIVRPGVPNDMLLPLFSGSQSRISRFLIFFEYCF